jgi:nitrite reductase/ring-hydroxylating ferredoxin subunit
VSETIRVCPREDLADGVQVVRLPDDELGRPREALVLLDGAGTLRAYLNRCEHLPIPLDGGSRDFLSADGRHLRCGTHGALYRREDGFCFEGPCAGKSLLALPVRVAEDGWVELEV